MNSIDVFSSSGLNSGIFIFLVQVRVREKKDRVLQVQVRVCKVILLKEYSTILHSKTYLHHRSNCYKLYRILGLYLDVIISLLLTEELET